MKPLNQWTPADLIALVKGIDRETGIKIGIGAGIFLFIFWLIIWPAWFKRVSIHTEIRNTQAKIAQLELLEKKQPEWLRNQADYSSFIQATKERIYLSGETELLLGEISKLAKDSGVSIIASRPQQSSAKFPPPFDQRYEASDYYITVEGSFHSLGKFISRIESYPKLLRVQTFSILPRDDSPESHIADIRISVHAMKQPASA